MKLVQVMKHTNKLCFLLSTISVLLGLHNGIHMYHIGIVKYMIYKSIHAGNHFTADTIYNTHIHTCKRCEWTILSSFFSVICLCSSWNFHWERHSQSTLVQPIVVPLFSLLWKRIPISCVIGEIHLIQCWSVLLSLPRILFCLVELLHFCDEILWGAPGGKRNKWLDVGSNLDHHAVCQIRNLAVTQQIMSGFWWNFQNSSAMIQETIDQISGGNPDKYQTKKCTPVVENIL